MKFFLVISAVIAAPVLGWRAFVAGRARQQVRQDEELRRRSTDEFLAKVQESIRVNSWERFAAGAALAQMSSTTDGVLRESMQTLYDAILVEDGSDGGRESGSFEWHDCGLAAIQFELERRAK